MSVMWPDDPEMESAEYDDSDVESYDDSDVEDYGGEESPSVAARRRRIQQRRVALARRRQAQARPRVARRPPPSTAAVPVADRQTAAEIRTLDLDAKVQGDTMRRLIVAQNQRMSRSEWAAVAGAATGQFIESFDEPDNVYFRAALRFSPLLLLAPRRTGTGLESFARDPRVIGGAVVAAITFAGDVRSHAQDVARIDLAGPNAVSVAAGQTRFFADVFDKSGGTLAKRVAWTSEDPAKATVDANGTLTPVAPGWVVLSATVDGVTRRFPLEIKP